MSATSRTSQPSGMSNMLLSVLVAAALALSPLALRHAWLGTHSHPSGHPSDEPLQKHEANHAFCLKCVLLSAPPIAAVSGVPAWQALLLSPPALLLVRPSLRLGYRPKARAPPTSLHSF